jgi:TRAP-type C4-dicarboxylate transport system permease small subunit
LRDADRRRAGTVLGHLNQAVERLEWIGSQIAGLSIFAIMVIVFLDVFFRYLVRAPFSWSYDLITLYLVPVLFFLSLSDTFRRNHHVAVDLFYFRFRETGKRLARFTIALLSIPVLLEIISLSTADAVTGYRNNEVLSGAILWPTWIPLFIVILGFGLLVLRLVLDAVALGVALGTRAPEVTGESPPRSRAAHHDEDIP